MANQAFEHVKQKLMALCAGEQGKPEAEKALDDFKQLNPHAVTCGLRLAEKAQSTINRLYGIQVLQYAVKNRWPSIPLNEQKVLKRNIMSLVSSGTKHITLEKPEIKEGFARLVVEMIKHDWPDEWPKLLVELDIIAKRQEVCAEMVLLVLWRLAEDVVTLRTETVAREPQLKRCLVENMKDILSIILGQLEKFVNRCRTLRSDVPQNEACRMVVNTAIYTLSCYISWMGVWHITQDNCSLLEMIWVLMYHPDFQLAAAECLIVGIKRMDKVKNCDVIRTLFGDSAMNSILSSAKINSVEVLTEKQKNVLKKICQLICVLGTTFCTLMNLNANIETPANFGRYLNTLLDFTERSSQFLHFPTHATWVTIFNQPVLSRDPKLLAILPKYLTAVVANLEKVGFHSKNTDSTVNTCLGLVTDKDFNATLKTIHDEQREVIKLACKVEPVVCLEKAISCLKDKLTPNNPRSNEAGIAQTVPSTLPSVEQWEAMTFFFETVINATFDLDKEKINVKDGLDLMKLVITYKTNDSAILSCVGRIISVLLPFFTAVKEFTPELLSMLFEFVEEIKDPVFEPMREMKTYAFACIIQMCRNYTLLVVPHFNLLFTNVKRLLANELLLTGKEKSWMTRCVVLLSNQLKNYVKQKAVLRELMEPVVALWQSDVLKWLLSDPESFISYVGADLQITVADPDNATAVYRSRLCYCVSSILEVLRWTFCPKVLQEAKFGGYVIRYMPNGDPVYQTPSTEIILPLLNNVLSLIRLLHILYLPEVINSIGGSFGQVLQKTESAKVPDPDTKHLLLESYSPIIYKSDLEKLQDFFSTLYEECFSILGTSAALMKQQFYSTNNLLDLLLNSAFINLDYLPNYRLTTMLLLFVKPLVLSCPPEQYQTLLCPIIAPFLAAIHTRLTNEWQIVEQQKKEGNNPESQETVDEEQVRLLTQEVIRFIGVCCVSTNTDTVIDADKSSVVTGAETPSTTDVQPPNVATPQLTELGTCLMKETDIRSALLITAFTSLVWKDSVTCYRSASHLCWPLLKEVVSEPLLPDAVTYFFTMVLKAIKEHTDHAVYFNALVQLGFQIYEALRPRYAELLEVMKSFPGIKEYYLVAYDKKVLAATITPQDYGLRKYYFTRIMQDYIGKTETDKEKDSKDMNASSAPPAAKKLKPLMSVSVELPRVPAAVHQEHHPAHLSQPEVFNTPIIVPEQRPVPVPFTVSSNFEPPFRNIVPPLLNPFAQTNVFETALSNPNPFLHFLHHFNELNQRLGLPVNNQEQSFFLPNIRSQQFLPPHFR